MTLLPKAKSEDLGGFVCACLCSFVSHGETVWPFRKGTKPSRVDFFMMNDKF